MQKINEWYYLACVYGFNFVIMDLRLEFESRGAHGCEEQWNVRDMMVHTGLGLLTDNNTTSYVHQFFLIAWVENPSTPPFIG
jgi:hypothetical protein